MPRPRFVFSACHAIPQPRFVFILFLSHHATAKVCIQCLPHHAATQICVCSVNVTSCYKFVYSVYHIIPGLCSFSVTPCQNPGLCSFSMQHKCDATTPQPCYVHLVYVQYVSTQVHVLFISSMFSMSLPRSTFCSSRLCSVCLYLGPLSIHLVYVQYVSTQVHFLFISSMFSMSLPRSTFYSSRLCSVCLYPGPCSLCCSRTRLVYARPFFQHATIKVF